MGRGKCFVLLHFCTHTFVRRDSRVVVRFTCSVLSPTMLEGKVVRWGICSTGRICHDFTGTLKSLPKEEHKVTAVAASTLDRAQKFADEFGIPKLYGSYQELANDPEVDIVYIGSINTKHYEHTKMMLEAGKAVLCEKPFCLAVKEAEELIELARKKNLFFMEAIWSRCFPLYTELQNAIHTGEIGEVRLVQVAIGKEVPENPSHRVMSMEQGGGGLYDLGIYALQLSQFVFNETPIDLQATGFLNDQGVDCMIGMTLKYSKRRLASMSCSTICTFSNEAYIQGTNGIIKVGSPFWCPTTLTINGKVKEFPLPKVETPMIFPNSEGLSFEAQEVRRCLLNGWTESPLVPHETTIQLAEVTEKLLKDVGYGILDKK